jgi:hypothetical protein
LARYPGWTGRKREQTWASRLVGSEMGLSLSDIKELIEIAKAVRHKTLPAAVADGSVSPIAAIGRQRRWLRLRRRSDVQLRPRKVGGAIPYVPSGITLPCEDSFDWRAHHRHGLRRAASAHGKRDGMVPRVPLGARQFRAWTLFRDSLVANIDSGSFIVGREQDGTANPQDDSCGRFASSPSQVRCRPVATRALFTGCRLSEHKEESIETTNCLSGGCRLGPASSFFPAVQGFGLRNRNSEKQPGTERGSAPRR